MTTKMNYIALAASMEPTDLELLLRAYCRTQMDRRTGLRQGRNSWDRTVNVRFELGMNEKHQITEGQWRVSGLGQEAEGQTLVPTMDEYCRRVGWENSGTAQLKLATNEARNVFRAPGAQIGLIEAAAEPADAESDI